MCHRAEPHLAARGFADYAVVTRQNMPGSSPAVNTRASSRHTQGTSPRTRPGPSKPAGSLNVKPIKRQSASSQKTSPNGGSSTSPASTSSVDSKMGTSQVPKKAAPAIERRRPSGQFQRAEQQTQRKSYPKRGDAAEMKADPTVTPPQSGSAQSTPKGPGIRTRLSTGSIHMNGTTTVSTAKEKAEMDQLMRQISKSLLGYDIEVHVASTEKSGTPRSTPGSGKKRSSSVVSGLGIEDLPVDHPPPKKRKIGRNDGSGEDNRNDYFCWMCHKEGTLVCCELCPRVYHIKCLGLTGELPQDWVCPECEKIMQAECVDTRSKSMEMLSLDQLCILLKYALDRMKHSGSEPFIKAVDPAHVPRYSDYIFNPMDMTTLEKNIKTKQYGCTEALLSDAKWILHNCIIYNGTHHSLTNSAKMIIKICKHETNEIELCPDCYLNSCIRKTEEWFSEPCRVPHTLVWAKLKGYPFWPAKALREVDGQVDVRFFGAHDRSWVSVSQCFMLSRNIPTTLQKGKKNAGLSGAIKELQIHINKVRERFGNFEYAPFRTPYDKTDSYKPITQKPGPSSSMLTSSSFYSQKSGQNQSKKSMVAKTASALKSKYNMMSSVKKIDASPRKVRTNRMRVMEDNDKLASNRKSDCSGDAPLDEEQDIEENDSKTSEDKLEQATKQDNIDINSALKTPTTSINKPESKSEGEKVSDNNVENMTAKTSFPSSSIVDRLAKKIQALNEETTTEESGNSENKIDTEVSEKDKGLESRVIEQFATDKLKTETPNVESETVNNELENSKQLAVDSEIEEKKTEMKEENDTEKTELKEEKDNEKCECDPSTENSSKDNKVEKTRSIQTETKTSCEPEEESDKPNVEQSANIEQIASGKADAQTNPEGSPNKSPNIHHEVMGKEAVAKETYKQKLISTIMSCKAKLGMEVSDKEVTAVGENNEGDDIDGGSINNTDSDEEDDDEQMDTGDTKEESDDSDSSDDLEMEVEEIGSDDDAEEDYESESSHDECAKGSSTVPELPLDSLKTPATETDKGESANDDSKVTVSEKVSPDNEREASESKQSATEENATQQKTPTSDSATAIAKEAVLQEKQADTMKSRTSDESTVSDQSVKTIEPDLTVETTENAVEKSPKQDKSGVVINEQTIKDSVKQIQTKSSPEKASSFLGNKNNTDAIEDGSKKSFKSTESIDEMGTNKDMFENDTIEEDSDIDRLVIDLDSENNSSPKATKFCVRGGEVKNGSDFKKCVSPLVSEKTIKQTVNKEKPTPNTAAEKKVYIIHDNKSTPAIETLAKISPVAKKSDPKETLSEKSESRQPDIENEQSAMEIEDLASSYGAGSLSSVQSLPETAVSRAGSEAGSFTTATPANRLAEKFSKQLMMTIQKTLDEMCVEVLQERVPEPSNSELQVQLQQARNDYSTQLSELKHNFKLTVWEMKGSWAAEKDQLTRNLERKHKAEMEKTVAEVKKKQWCSQCGKEAIFYCCWNTSYCDYPCQQNHWPQHMHTCLQTNKDKPGAVTPISTASSSQPAAINLVSSSGIVTCGPSSACAVSSSSGSSPQGNHHIRQRLQDTISAALQREEEKRGEIRTGPSPKFVSMPTPMNALPNTRQSTPVSFGSSLLFPSNIASNNQMVPHSRPGMIQQIPRNMLLNPPMRMSVQTSRPVNNMLLPQPMIQQQAMYPVQLQHHQQQQQQQQHMGGAILFQNPQPNLMGYNMRPPF